MLLFFEDRVFEFEAGLKLLILLPHHSQYWDHKHVPPHPAIDFFFFSFFAVLGVKTQGLTLGRQAHYHLSHSTSPNLCFFYFLA
jgi:hypothetical protein